jgi:hypothetical protein
VAQRSQFDGFATLNRRRLKGHGAHYLPGAKVIGGMRFVLDPLFAPSHLADGPP